MLSSDPSDVATEVNDMNGTDEQVGGRRKDAWKRAFVPWKKIYLCHMYIYIHILIEIK